MKSANKKIEGYAATLIKERQQYMKNGKLNFDEAPVSAIYSFVSSLTFCRMII